MLGRLFFITVLFFVSCAVISPGEHPGTSAEEVRDELLTEIRALDYAASYRELRKAGTEYLSRFEGDPSAREVRLLVGKADVALGFYEDARKVLAPFVDAELAGPHAGQAYLLLAEIDRAKGSFEGASEKLLSALGTDLDDADRAEARNSLSEVVQLLSIDQLKRIGTRYESTEGIDIVLEQSLSAAQSLQDTTAAREIGDKLAVLASRMPESDRSLPQGETVSATVKGDAGKPRRYRMGLMCPLSGRYSPIGEAFLRGASLAVKEERRLGFSDVEVTVGDTRANALAARTIALRLIDEEHVDAIVGSVLSTTTITAAQVAQDRGVVLLSPVATEQGIDDIGEWVFQMGIEDEVEILALARLACLELHYERIACLSVDDLHSRRLELLFRDEVERLGGEIVISEFYPEGSTDFQEYIERIRSASPEALLIPSDPEDLILILPQLSFYEFGVQLFGTSTWNSRSLQKTVGRDMEGAIFPAVIDEKEAEKDFAAAVAAIGEPVEEFNRFIIGGYRGVRTVLDALRRSGGGGEPLRLELSKRFEDRRHPYLDYMSSSGIEFYIFRGDNPEQYTVLKFGH